MPRSLLDQSSQRSTSGFGVLATTRQLWMREWTLVQSLKWISQRKHVLIWLTNCSLQDTSRTLRSKRFYVGKFTYLMPTSVWDKYRGKLIVPSKFYGCDELSFTCSKASGCRSIRCAELRFPPSAHNFLHFHVFFSVYLYRTHTFIVRPHIIIVGVILTISFSSSHPDQSSVCSATTGHVMLAKAVAALTMIQFARIHRTYYRQLLLKRSMCWVNYARCLCSSSSRSGF